jgi:hypothetical protein
LRLEVIGSKAKEGASLFVWISGSRCNILGWCTPVQDVVRTLDPAPA